MSEQVGSPVTLAKQTACSPLSTKLRKIVFWDVTPCDLVPKETAEKKSN
jgi:hypothetical protein